MKWAALLVSLFVSLNAVAEPRRIVPPELPSGDVSAVARSQHQLFIGSFDQGLFVLRGDAMERVESGVNPNINALAWDERAQVLWVGTARGVSRCVSKPGMPLDCRRVGHSVSVHALLLARDGTVIAGTEQGLSLFKGDRSQSSFGAKQRTPFRAVWALAESENGELFVGTTSGLYWTRTAALVNAAPELAPSFARASLVSGELPDDWVTALIAQAGELHVGTYNAGLVSFKVQASRLGERVADASLGYVNPAGITRLRNGQLAVATMDGLRVGTPGAFQLRATLGQDVTQVLPARAQGQYWIATRRGLERLDLEAPTL
ncbi:MAG: hypothetical protein ACOY0T_09035 [Myxococcota bacterium]